MLPSASVSQTDLEDIITRHLFVSKSFKGNLCEDTASASACQGYSSLVAMAELLSCWLALTVESPHEVMNKWSSLCFCHGITWVYQPGMSRNLFYKTTLF